MIRFWRRWKWTTSAVILVLAANIICVVVWHDWWIPVFTVLSLGYAAWEHHRGVRR